MWLHKPSCLQSSWTRYCESSQSTSSINWCNCTSLLTSIFLIVCWREHLAPLSSSWSSQWLVQPLLLLHLMNCDHHRDHHRDQGNCSWASSRSNTLVCVTLLALRLKFMSTIIIAIELAHSFQCNVCRNWTEHWIVTSPHDSSQIVAWWSSCWVGSSTLVQQTFHNFASTTRRLEMCWFVEVWS